MGRSSRRRRSSVDAFNGRAVYFLLAIFLLVGSVGRLASEQALVAALLLGGGLGLTIWIWRRRQRARQIEAKIRLRRLQRLGELLTMSPAEFEGAVAELFRALGYRDVKHIGGSGDLGVDLTAIAPNGQRVIVQCKRYSPGNKVGSPAVQNLMGAVVNHGAACGFFVTTSEFTGPAKQLAQTSRVPISLIDASRLVQLAEQAQAGAPPVVASAQPTSGYKEKNANGRARSVEQHLRGRPPDKQPTGTLADLAVRVKPCPVCQNKNGAKAKFCTSCGSNLRGMCPQCGTAYSAADAFCAACGALLGTHAKTGSLLGLPMSSDNVDGAGSGSPSA